MDASDTPLRNHLLRQERIKRNWRQQDLADQLGTTELTVKRWERGSQQPSAYFRVKLCTLFEKSAEELGLVSDEPVVVSDSPEETSTWSVPFARNLYFTGRDQVLKQLHTVLTSEPTMAALTQSYALSGLGGIGKTQLAVEYTYRYRSEYTAVFWVEAETQTSLTASFVRLATLLALPERKEEDQSQIVEAVVRWLNRHEGWLLVFDNVESLSLIKPFLPASDRGALLLTTRLQTLGTLAHRIELPPLTVQEGCDFLLARTNRLRRDKVRGSLDAQERAAAQAIVTEMGGLPLALEQAGAYINATQCSLEDYLHLFQATPHRLLDEHEEASDHPLSVDRTFALAFEQGARRSPLAVDLLKVCVFLAPDAIPETIFQGEPSLSGPLFEAMERDPLAFSDALKVLLSYSLIRRHPGTQTLSLHRLVQAVLRARMTAEEREEWLRRVLHRLSALFPDGSYETWRQCELLLPHALACVTALPESDEDLELARLLQSAATYLSERVQQYELVEKLYQRALRIRLRRLGPEHLEVAASLYGLAGVYEVWRKSEEAESFSKRALDIYERILGPQHRDVANALYRLVSTYIDQGRLEEAEPLSRRVLDIYEQVLGPTHTEVARALNCLAIIYCQQGNLEKGEPLFERALRIYEQTVGWEHPDCVSVLTNLADLRQAQKRYEEAELLYQRVLSAWEQILGPESINVASTLPHLADLLCTLGRYEEAQPLYERSLRIWEQAVGAEHPGQIFALNGLANLFREHGKYELARQLYQRALKLGQQQLTPPHPVLAETLYNLARIHHLQQQTAEALSLYQQALTMCEQVYGPQHSKTEEARQGIAQLSQETRLPEESAAQEAQAQEQERFLC